MLGPAWPLAPVLGQVFKGWAWNSRAWVRTRGAEWSNVQVFAASGRYTPSDDLIYCIVECIGAGGGGGWATRGTNVLTGMSAAGGGGSGGYSRKTLPAEVVIQGADVTVAAGGLVGFNATGWQFAGDTNFGGLCIAKGGQNAMPYDGQNVTGVIPSFGQAGAGAPVGIGDIALPGAMGAFWTTQTSWQASETTAVYLTGGWGGTLFGGNNFNLTAWSPNTTVNGTNGSPNSGAGGSGGQVASSGTALGGAGGSGLVIVTEICGTPGNGGGPEPPIDPTPPGWPPGVPFTVNARVAVTHEGPPAPEPVK